MIVAEARGKNEDGELRRSFLRTTTNGTPYLRGERFAKIRFELTFLPKAMNIVGTQLADLAGYPIARHVLDPAKPNPAFAILEPKLYRQGRDRHGLRIFP